MKEGMLWLDDDRRLSLAEKVERAADYYRNKYGQTPNYCLVNRSMLTEEEAQVGKIQVRPAGNVLPNYLWLGMKSS
jgi:hypothetical protein